MVYLPWTFHVQTFQLLIMQVTGQRLKVITMTKVTLTKAMKTIMPMMTSMPVED